MKDISSIYLNNAATSYPKPPAVIEAMTHCLAAPPYHSERGGLSADRENVLGACREKLARLMNAPQPLDIVLGSGATEALNLILFGFDWQGGHILTTVTEHNSVIRPLTHLQQKQDIDVTYVDCDQQGHVSADAIQQALKPHTQAILINHCSNVTGTVQDLEAISKIAKHNHVLFFVDASQSLGLYNIDVQALGIDALIFTGHKSLYGPQGTGGCYLREGLEPTPLKVGGTGVRSDLLSQPPVRPLYYESGTVNTPGFAGLSAGLDYVLHKTPAKLRSHKESLCRYLVGGLTNLPEVACVGPAAEKHPSTLVSFKMKELDPGDVGYMFEESFGITVRTGLHCAPLIHKALGSAPKGTIRISPSSFTTIEHMDALLNAVQQVANMGVMI